MKKPQILVGVAGLALGLLLGGAFIGRAHAQQPGARFQYMCQTKLNKIWTPEAQARLNELGSQGWQLLPTRSPMNEDVYCYERRF